MKKNVMNFADMDMVAGGSVRDLQAGIKVVLNDNTIPTCETIPTCSRPRRIPWTPTIRIK